MVSGFLVSISLKVTVFLVVAKAAKARVTREGEKIKKRVLKGGGGGGGGGYQFHFTAHFFSKPTSQCSNPIPTSRIQTENPSGIHTSSFVFASTKLRLLNTTQQRPKNSRKFAKMF